MSRAESTSDAPRGVLVRRQKTTIYTVLLILTAAALGIGCLMMILELWQYGFVFKVPANLR